MAAEEEEGRCGGGVGVGEEETAEVATTGMRERGEDQRGTGPGDWGDKGPEDGSVREWVGCEALT